MKNAKVNEAISAALVLKTLAAHGYPSGNELAVKDMVVMADHINNMRDICHQACEVIRKVRRGIDATASPEHAAWASELEAAIDSLVEV